MKKDDKKKAKKVSNLSKVWLDTRTKCGKTREFMGKALNVSDKTIQNWENGFTAPDVISAIDWFKVLGLNPLPYFISYLNPNLFDPDKADDADNQVVEDTLNDLVNHLNIEEKRQLLFLMAGQHGSSFHSQLQMFTAHAHTSMQSRVGVSRTILANYNMEAATDRLVCKKDVGPDLELLEKAVDAGYQAVLDGRNGYVPYSLTDPIAAESDEEPEDKE